MKHFNFSLKLIVLNFVVDYKSYKSIEQKCLIIGFEVPEYIKNIFKDLYKYFSTK